MDIMDSMNIMDIKDIVIMIITAWMAMAGAVRPLFRYMQLLSKYWSLHTRTIDNLNLKC